VTHSYEVEATIREIGKKYLFWTAAGGGEHPIKRVIAQIMNFGVPEDLAHLEALVGPHALGRVMRYAEPGWFRVERWRAWRVSLPEDSIGDLAEEPPRRT